MPCLERLSRREPQRADAAGHAHVLAAGRFDGEFRRGPVDLVDPALEAVFGQPRGVRAEAVGLDHPRAGGDVFFMDAADQIGLADAKLLETAFERDAGFEDHGPHGAVARDDLILKNFE